MLTADPAHPLVGRLSDWSSIAKEWFNCAQALSQERQSRGWKLEGEPK